MSIFSANIAHRSYHFQISSLALVLGFLLAAAVFTTSDLNTSGVVSAVNPALSYGPGLRIVDQKIQSAEDEIKKLRNDKTDLENRLAKGSGAARALNRDLQDTKAVAGLTEMVGPGVEVILTDAPQTGPGAKQPFNLGDIIHDVDVRNVVDELKACGAEAVAVNHQRIVGNTAIRCVGPVIHVNMVPTAPPYVVDAIGDPTTLLNGMNLPNGVVDELRRVNPAMIRIDKKPKLRLPAYAGSTRFVVARPVQRASDSDQPGDHSN